MPTWKEIADAIWATVATASGLETIWRNQNKNAPPLDYLDISLGNISTVWVDWIEERYVAGNDDGEQIELTVGGLREVPLQLEAWSSALVEDTARATALTILDNVVTKLRLPTARAMLASVGVTPFDPGPVLWVPSMVSAGFRGRATCDIRCRMPARALQEYADWVETVSGDVEIANPAAPSGAPLITIPFDTA